MQTRLEECRRDVEKVLKRHKMRGVVYLTQVIDHNGGKGIRCTVAQHLEPLIPALAVSIAKQMEANLAPIFAALYRYADLHAKGGDCGDVNCESHGPRDAH